MGREEISTSHTADKGLYPDYTESQNVTAKEIKLPLSKWATELKR